MKQVKNLISNIFSKIRSMNPRLRKYILIILFVLLVLFGASKMISARNQPKQNVTVASAPQKTQTVNQEFTFPVGAAADNSTINMKFTIQDASINNEIVVQGKNATAVAGRTFLIVTIKIANNFNQSIQINTRDYVRLSVNNDQNTWLAPDIHNDPVEVQAISTKYTRVGFAVNTSDKNFVLQIGEIKGNKQKIELKNL